MKFHKKNSSFDLDHSPKRVFEDCLDLLRAVSTQGPWDELAVSGGCYSEPVKIEYFDTLL